jgi:hypothetical protein
MVLILMHISTMLRVCGDWLMEDRRGLADHRMRLAPQRAGHADGHELIPKKGVMPEPFIAL